MRGLLQRGAWRCHPSTASVPITVLHYLWHIVTFLIIAPHKYSYLHTYLLIMVRCSAVLICALKDEPLVRKNR